MVVIHLKKPFADFNTRRTEIRERHSVDLTHTLKKTTFLGTKKKINNKSTAAELLFISCRYLASPYPGKSADLLLIKCESDGFVFEKKRVGS